MAGASKKGDGKSMGCRRRKGGKKNSQGDWNWGKIQKKKHKVAETSTTGVETGNALRYEKGKVRTLSQGKLKQGKEFKLFESVQESMKVHGNGGSNKSTNE